MVEFHPLHLKDKTISVFKSTLLNVAKLTGFTHKKTCELYNDLKFYLINCLGQLDRILIHPGKIMKVYATLKGAIKKYVGKKTHQS